MSFPIVKCFLKFKMMFSIAYQNSWQCWVKPTTQLKPTYKCQFFNQHWGDKILVESKRPFWLTEHFSLLDEAHPPLSRSQSWTFNYFANFMNCHLRQSPIGWSSSINKPWCHQRMSWNFNYILTRSSNCNFNYLTTRLIKKLN